MSPDDMSRADSDAIRPSLGSTEGGFGQAEKPGRAETPNRPEPRVSPGRAGNRAEKPSRADLELCRTAAAAAAPIGGFLDISRPFERQCMRRISGL